MPSFFLNYFVKLFGHVPGISVIAYVMRAQRPNGTINIPRIENEEMFERNRERADEAGFDHCPCCGRAIKNPKYFFNSIFGGCAYPANGPDTETIGDAWVMGVGSECRKRFPAGYVFEK